MHMHPRENVEHRLDIVTRDYVTLLGSIIKWPRILPLSCFVLIT